MMIDFESIVELERQLHQWGFCNPPYYYNDCKARKLLLKMLNTSHWHVLINHPLSDENRAKIKMLLGPHGLTICRAMLVQLEEMFT